MNLSVVSGGQCLDLLSAVPIPTMKPSTLKAFRELLLQSGYARTDASEENASLKMLKSLFVRGETVEKEGMDGVIETTIWKALIESRLIEEHDNFEPVLGRKFDLIVANLPYVIAPAKKYIYRDPDQPGDQSIRKILLETPEYLNEGGFAHVIITWINRGSEPWWALLKEMRQCAQTDSWLNHNGSRSADEYAAMWISTDAKKEPKKYSKEIVEWTNWDRSQGYVQFELGAMTMRHRFHGKNWCIATEVKKFLSDSLGEELNQLFENQDDLENQANLLDAKFIVHNLEIEPKKLLARTIKGFLFQTKISAYTLNVVNELRDRITLREAIKRAAGKIGFLEDQNQTVMEITQLLNFGMLKVDGSV